MEDIISRIFAYVFTAIVFLPMVYAVVSAFNPKYKTRSKYYLERVVEIYFSETFGRAEKFIQQRLPVLVEQWGEIIVRAIAKLIATAVTIFLIIHEFPELIDNMNFVLLLMTWGFYALLVFWFDYRKKKAEPTSERIDTLITKVDELITEIREDRNERRNSNH